jgi:hypothetical protein
MIKLTRKQAKLFKKRWQQAEAKQAQELRTMSVSLKFKQLCFLMDSFPPGQPDRQREKEVIEIRKRWLTLNKKLKNENK